MSVFHTGFYVSALILLNIILSVRIILLRRRHKVGIGTGKNLELSLAIRAHANLVEHAPLALILIACVELSLDEKLWVNILGLTLIVARFLHAWGISHRAGTSIGRFAGTFLTFSVGLTGAVIIALQGLGLLR